MDFATIIGIVFGVGMIFAAFLVEGGNPAALFLISPFMIVFGGTFGALTTSFTLKEIFSMPGLIMSAMMLAKGNDASIRQLIDVMVNIAEKARREGVLSLESDIQGELSDKKYDPMLRKGLRLTVDGSEPELIKHMLENEIGFYEEQQKKNAAIFEAAGGFSPTMGIIGTVMGLINVLGNLANPDELGPAVAMAFVATLWGIGSANLFFLPIGGKLKLKMKQEVVQKELIIEGVMSIQAGENPRTLKEKLDVFLSGR
ncbi:MAG TPA: flagellar motor protein [Fibrobacteres bacterium]|nr:flagellar motor protein [Fibrobacterota bacterium]